MTILLIIKRFDFGGAENHVCELANNLSKKGHKVILVGGKGRQVKKLLPGVKYIPVKLTDLSIPYHVLKLVFLILQQRVNIIHAHQRLAILNACLAGFLTRRKVISTIHGRFRYDMRHALSRLLTSKMIFVSKKIHEVSDRRYDFGEKGVFIPNCVKTEAVKNSSIPYRICYTSKINKKHLGFLKLMISNVLPVLKQKYPTLELWIIGDGKKLDELKELADNLNNKFSSSLCNVLGYKPSVLNYYQSASLVLGVGRVALEASAIGVPVLSVNCRRMGGLLTTKKYENIKYANFIDTKASPPCKHSIQTTIEEFFNHQSKWEKEAEYLVKKIKKDFSLDDMINRTVSLYEDVILKSQIKP